MGRGVVGVVGVVIVVGVVGVVVGTAAKKDKANGKRDNETPRQTARNAKVENALCG